MPARKPAGLKILGGRGDGRDAAGYKVPLPPPFERVPPEAPPDLDAEAAAEWARVTDELGPLGVLKQSDYAVLMVHCETWSVYRRAVAQVRAEGLVVVSERSGVAHKHPALAAAEVARKDLLRTASELGLSPASEQRIGKLPVDSGDDDNPFAG